ncbi:hypothetical protein CR513_48136, partial [Mucuna pruriens]
MARYKPRLVAKGFHQLPEMDYHDTLNPSVEVQTIKLVLFFAISKRWSLSQMDVPYFSAVATHLLLTHLFSCFYTFVCCASYLSKQYVADNDFLWLNNRRHLHDQLSTFVHMYTSVHQPHYTCKIQNAFFATLRTPLILDL